MILRLSMSARENECYLTTERVAHAAVALETKLPAEVSRVGHHHCVAILLDTHSTPRWRWVTHPPAPANHPPAPCMAYTDAPGGRYTLVPLLPATGTPCATGCALVDVHVAHDAQIHAGAQQQRLQQYVLAHMFTEFLHSTAVDRPMGRKHYTKSDDGVSNE